jgi:iron complex outermembrane receptor protein
MQITAPMRRLALSTILLSGVAGSAWAQTAGNVVNAGEVNANGGGGGGGIGTQLPTPTQVFNSGETVRVLTPEEQQMLGPAVGGAQGLSLAPGAYVNGYGNSGATKYTIALDGIGQGWGGYGGYTGGASLMVTMDGVPIVDPITGLWASASIPNMQMFQGTSITYGPGNAADRWYDNIGGEVEFTPLQPSKTAGGLINLTYGSFDDQILNFALNSGQHNGWSTIIEGSFEDGNSYRVGPDGFNNPYNDYALFTKTVKQFDGGDISVGAYYSRSAGYRPSVIPTEPNSQIGIFGNTSSNVALGPLYSQKTSGFYSSLPYDTYEKFDVDQLWTAYSKFNYNFDDTTSVHNIMYYVREDRLHDRSNDSFPVGAANQFEYNNPYSYWYGDKVDVTKNWWFNTFDTGAFIQNSTYNTSNAFYSPFPPYDGSVTAPNNKYRSGMFTQLDTAVFAQDDIHPLSDLHITPGIRLAMYNTSYNDAGPYNFPGATGTNQGALGNGLPGYQTRNYLAPEPSLEITYQPQKWLNLYASAEQAYKTPQVGGGGGLYQSIDSQYAQLALATEYQIGFKVLTDQPDIFLHNFDFGANYFFLRYAKQTITTTNAVGTATTAFGTSNYQGANFFVDDNPFLALHTFVNASIVNATYVNYVTGSFAAPVSYNGRHVPYVPGSTLNVGADYKFLTQGIVVDPYALFQFSGSQYIFNNVTGAPSNQTLSAYGTLNVGINATVPITLYGKDRDINLSLSVLNATNNKYNNYLYLSSGGYYNTTTSGYGLGYPAPPMTIYGSVGVSF